MAISGLTSNTALPASLLAASDQPALNAGEIVPARVVGQTANGLSQLAIGKQVLAVALPDHPATGTVLLLQAGSGERGQPFTVIAEVPPDAAGSTALVPPQARLRLQALGLLPEQVFSATVLARTPQGLTRLAIGDTLIDLLLPRSLAPGDTARLQLPRDWSKLSLLRLVGDGAPVRERGGAIPLSVRSLAALARLGMAPGSAIAAKVLGPNLVAIGDETLELSLPQAFTAGTVLQLQWPAEDADHLLLVSATSPRSTAQREVAITSPSLPALKALGLKPGQRIAAEVLRQLPSGETAIAIGGKTLTVTLPEARQAGVRLSLLVQGSPEQPRLVLVPQAAPPGDLAALRQSALANQGSLGAVLANLSKLDGAPPAVANAAAPLAQAMLSLDGESISGSDLRQAMLNSGVFLEARGEAAPADIKAALLGLRGALAAWLGAEGAVASGARRPLPPTRNAVPRAHTVPLGDAAEVGDPMRSGRELLGDTDAALNRLRLLQLANLPDPTASQAAQKAPLVTVEVPLQLGKELSMAQLQVLRDGGNGTADAGERGWQMRFSVNYTITGEVGAQIMLRGKRVSVSLWAERQATASVLQAMLPDLRPGLSGRGIDAVSLSCRLGRPPEATATPSGQYVDAVK